MKQGFISPMNDARKERLEKIAQREGISGPQSWKVKIIHTDDSEFCQNFHNFTIHQMFDWLDYYTDHYGNTCSWIAQCGDYKVYSPFDALEKEKAHE